MTCHFYLQPLQYESECICISVDYHFANKMSECLLFKLDISYALHKTPSRIILNRFHKNIQCLSYTLKQVLTNYSKKLYKKVVRHKVLNKEILYFLCFQLKLSDTRSWMRFLLELLKLLCDKPIFSFITWGIKKIPVLSTHLHILSLMKIGRYFENNRLWDFFTIYFKQKQIRYLYIFCLSVRFL